MNEIDIHLGTEVKTGRECIIPTQKLRQHLHLIGGTGKGKTTALHTILHGILTHPHHQTAVFIIDRMGNLSDELLLWMSSPFCPDYVRKRLLYIEPAREGLVCPLHPLSYTTEANAYYRVKRATELILRSWTSQDLQIMARLARWTYYSLMSAAYLRLALSDCWHFLEPYESRNHSDLIRRLPPRLQSKWAEIHGEKRRALDILDSTRNRLEPFFGSSILRRIFGATQTTMDIHSLRRDARIVLVNLNPCAPLQGELDQEAAAGEGSFVHADEVIDQQLADTIGAVFLNELFRSAHSHRQEPYPTYVFLDEFQNFVAPDLGDMLPAVRQLGLRLVLSHQSFSQLKKGEVDLSAIIFQCQNRLTFGLQGPDDADLMANELAACTFDEKAIKHIQYCWRQLVTGYDREIVHSGGESRGSATTHSEGDTLTGSQQETHTFPPDMFGRPIITRGTGRANAHMQSQGTSDQQSQQSGWSETLVPKHETYQEPRITWQTFDEWKHKWGRELRISPTGFAMLQLEGDPTVYHVRVHEDKPAYLKYDLDTLRRHFPALVDAKDQLVEQNYRSELFLPAHVVDSQANLRIEEALRRPVIELPARIVRQTPSSQNPASDSSKDDERGPSPFVT